MNEINCHVRIHDNVNGYLLAIDIDVDPQIVIDVLLNMKRGITDLKCESCGAKIIKGWNWHPNNYPDGIICDNCLVEMISDAGQGIGDIE